MTPSYWAQVLGSLEVIGFVAGIMIAFGGFIAFLINLEDGERLYTLGSLGVMLLGVLMIVFIVPLINWG